MLVRIQNQQIKLSELRKLTFDGLERIQRESPADGIHLADTKVIVTVVEAEVSQEAPDMIYTN
jgi:hypothetical protein